MIFSVTLSLYNFRKWELLHSAFSISFAPLLSSPSKAEHRRGFQSPIIKLLVSIEKGVPKSRSIFYNGVGCSTIVQIGAQEINTGSSSFEGICDF